MPKFRFPLAKNTPTDSEYKEICPDGGSRPSCQLMVTAQSGAYPPSDSHGNLTVVNLPLEPTGNGCETLIEVFMQTGCPPDTIDMTWDDVYSDNEIDRSNSANIGVSDGYGPFGWEIVGGRGFTLAHAETEERTNVLYADSTACGTAQIQVIDMCQTEIIGDVTCEQLPLLAWDYDNSAETINRSDSVSVYIVGGEPPFMWTVAGDGFHVETYQTYSRTNILYANATACGSATITVTDDCGDTTSGDVRCSAGQWLLIEDAESHNTTDLACPESVEGFDGSSPLFGYSKYNQLYRTKTIGKYKVDEYNKLLYDWFSVATGTESCYDTSNFPGPPAHPQDPKTCDPWDGGHPPGRSTCLSPLVDYYYESPPTKVYQPGQSDFPCGCVHSTLYSGSDSFYCYFIERYLYEWVCT